MTKKIYQRDISNIKSVLEQTQDETSNQIVFK